MRESTNNDNSKRVLLEQNSYPIIPVLTYTTEDILSPGDSVKDSWELKVATEVDVDPAVEDLSDHMNDRQRAAFRDKLQRYVRKPDRELILAVLGGQTLGLVCVIEQARFPPRLPEQQASHLRNFGCGTQLLVHPSYRNQGVGGSLLARAEHWAHEQGFTGFWIVTHRMADWYKTHFAYQEIHRLDDKGVEKILMSKSFE